MPSLEYICGIICIIPRLFLKTTIVPPLPFFVCVCFHSQQAVAAATQDKVALQGWQLTNLAACLLGLLTRLGNHMFQEDDGYEGLATSCVRYSDDVSVCSALGDLQLILSRVVALFHELERQRERRERR